jgi:hypothetical protein
VITNDSIIFCIGDTLIQESKFENYPGFMGASDTSIDYLALALGVAMASSRRVVVLCDDNYLLSHLTTVGQISVSECTNLYIIFFRTSSYGTGLVQPTITRSIRSLKGVLFNLGALVHEYTPYFDDPRGAKKLAAIFDKSLGPLIASVDIDNLRLYNKQVVTYDFNKFREYILEPKEV